MLYSVVIPVFNSSQSIKLVVQKTVEFFENKELNYEIILINDGSKDYSWDEIKKLSLSNRKIKSINLLKNYGQHIAMKCGLIKSKGDWVITIDDDLQNNPNEIKNS